MEFSQFTASGNEAYLCLINQSPSHEGLRGSGGIAVGILNPSARRRREGSFTPQHVLSNPSFTNNPIIIRHIIWAIEGVVK
jgi:hypothetical protein